jgi:hypothetical protein
MDAKITLSFNKEVAENAKKFAEENNISLSRLVEFLLQKATSSGVKSFTEYPVSDWVSMVAEGEATYISKPKNRKDDRNEFYKSKK